MADEYFPPVELTSGQTYQLSLANSSLHQDGQVPLSSIFLADGSALTIAGTTQLPSTAVGPAQQLEEGAVTRLPQVAPTQDVPFLGSSKEGYEPQDEYDAQDVDEVHGGEEEEEEYEEEEKVKRGRRSNKIGRPHKPHPLSRVEHFQQKAPSPQNLLDKATRRKLAVSFFYRLSSAPLRHLSVSSEEIVANLLGYTVRHVRRLVRDFEEGVEKE
uniref:Uncharacterized protein n=1 Tax=Palpitomonas bilix TaxID=652834 RepID=A0A7S3D8B6_9EUKA|mmetsp:Transcript_26420/g.67481  ORF Transcript_26420/g.67481 Transcript_26420/m.67481 type:complete len:214 (+) Transcript_26420:414-1055(+)